jgi:hypothetical protein
MRTYPLALSRWANPVDLWTLGGIANSLQNCGLACICPSNNKDSELDIFGDFGEELLGVHSTKVLQDRNSQGSQHACWVGQN